jgi:putative FmdB family regulatory protein
MPIYEYSCESCGATSEQLVLGSSTPSCERCGSEKLTKLMSVAAPPGRSAGLVRSARAQVARAGHLSHYSPSERSRSGT